MIETGWNTQAPEKGACVFHIEGIFCRRRSVGIEGCPLGTGDCRESYDLAELNKGQRSGMKEDDKRCMILEL